MADVGRQINASLDDDDLNEDSKSGGFGAKKILLFVVLPILLLGGIGGGLYFSGMLGGSDKEQSNASDKTNPAKKGGSGMGAAFLEIPDMTVNLSSTDGQPRFLRLSVQLELLSEADKAAVELVMPRVVDQFQTYLRELRVRDLRGSAGIYRLQMELLARVNAAAYPVEVQDVLFQEILIQ
ncbi:MAG: flagellar basal body protein FliL [Alphaproteobacteria bacterium]|nr:flagellar basal body protein FliL [Alphaproteobacteria bacterium]NCQ87590.1 flagellar basal body protein FliL [Alphaproteobacteria bacterium]NCT06459.1 flagellar basal body protein FliL [Alphaproteobacteria bacterium]